MKDAMTSADELDATREACVVHARALMESAKAVSAAGHHNIAYHLTVLALEEMGRRELLGVKAVAIAQSRESPPWADKQSLNHVQKLFWCFFGAHFFAEKLTAKALETMQGFAKSLHEKRLSGLYVGNDEDGLRIPADAIGEEEFKNLISLADAHLELAQAKEAREKPTQELLDLQAWFLGVAEDPEKRKAIFAGGSMSKLADLKNVQAWVQWLKDEFQKVDEENLRLAQLEIERSKNLDGSGEKNKWKIRIRLFSASHSVRQKELNAWNSRIDGVKLSAVSGKNNQMIMEVLLRDNVPIQAIWPLGWGLARVFVMALNIGSMGFWWWRLPEHVSKFYDSIEDLEARHKVAIERSPSLKLDWGENRVLKAAELINVEKCMSIMINPKQREESMVLRYYITGLTFLSLNDVHWQCEREVCANFCSSMRAMMVEVNGWEDATPFVDAFTEYLQNSLNFAGDDLARCVQVVRAFQAESLQSETITLQEAGFMKLFCDTYYNGIYFPAVAPKRFADLDDKNE